MFRNRPKKARPMDLDLGAEAAISFSRFCPTLKLLPMHSLYKVLCDNSSVFRSPPRRWIYPCGRVKRDRFLTGWACDEGSFRWRNTSFYARLASYMWVMKAVTKAHAPRLPCWALIICIPLSQASAADNAKVITSDGSRMQLELSQTHRNCLVRARRLKGSGGRCSAWERDWQTANLGRFLLDMMTHFLPSIKMLFRSTLRFLLFSRSAMYE